ncbi:LPXTG-motif cell wall anchor domain-containing protein [Clostridium amylolyticum]|uniref:LPXTG-motif cell wall anchor domain-containing protein n=1 Tax=Clostridium amylolyticum TaxID=1121298 RepID=A0A1M6NR38_9CLOT|nr:DUF4430 domain-containing protein [Clostridium amylolyticum]SHJ98110.1 LPXTG-motif cell wall anchor domain-containing protein [Clostridium amylolyticum]
MSKKIRVNILSFMLSFIFVVSQIFTGVTVKAEEVQKNLKVKVRIEANDRTIIPETEVEVSNFDLKPYNCDNLQGDPKAIHAIIRALEKNGLNPKDKEKFDFGSGMYISKVDGVAQGSFGSLDGWGYYINDSYTDKYVSQQDLLQGDSIVLFFMENYAYARYGFFDKKSVNVKVGEEFTLELTGKYFFSTGIPKVVKLIDNAKILVNDAISSYVTDENGKVTMSFDKPGTYIISADKKVNECDPLDYSKRNKPLKYTDRMLSRAYSKVVVELPDTNAPIIDTDLTNKKVQTPNFQFKVSAKDDIDGNIIPAVKLGDKILEPSEPGIYNVTLNKGKNSIYIEAIDKAFNKAFKEIIIEYNEVLPPASYDIKKEVEDTLKYMKLNNGDEWDALSLSKFNIKGNKEYLNSVVKDFKQGVKEYGLSDYFYKDTDLEKMIIYLVSQGYNPYNFLGYDLVKELYNRDIEEFNMFAQIFALITFDYANIKGDYKITRDGLIDKLLEAKSTYIDENGNKVVGWTFFGDTVDIDTTAAVISALSNYYDTNSKVKETLDDSVNTLSLLQKGNGGYEAWGSYASESVSFTILALTSLGIDPEGKLFTKNEDDISNNLVSALLSFKGSDGKFKHTKADEDNAMSTEQAFRALIAINEFKVKGRYNYYSSEIQARDLPIYYEKDNSLSEDNNPTQQNNSKSEAANIDSTENIDKGEKENIKSNNNLPKTGSSANINLVVLLGISSIAAGCFFIGKRKMAK